MRRGVGYVALFAFLLTGLHFASGPAALRQSPDARTTETAAAARTPAHEDTVCQAFEPAAAQNGKTAPTDSGQISDLVTRFLYGSSQASILPPAGLPPGIRIMIATIPDPRHTHLSLQFDRTLEALQQAAQDERYTYDSSWLPWKPASVEYSSFADRHAQMEQEEKNEICPGVLLFRRSMSGSIPEGCKDLSGAPPLTGNAPYQCGLIIFVVGEQPTQGLNRVQWDNTLRWIDRYANKNRSDKALRVLGPNFSGSMPSFLRALEVTGMYSGTFTGTLLYTGRIRGCASWRWFKQELNPPPDSGSAPATTVRLPVRLANFEENDGLQTDRLYRYLEDHGHHLSEIAILSEDETAYGGLPDAAARPVNPSAPASENAPCNPEYHESDRPVHLYYPRDISAIRSAYQEQSIFSSSSRSDSATQPRTVLHPDSSQSAHGESDTIEPFSGTNLALTQEAQLYGIVNTLKTHGIRYIVLRSTNSLDYLFLTRFLHRAYPTAYIITMGSDLLFGREVDSTEFRGIVALSTFPLLPRGQDWTRQFEDVPQHAHRVFGSYTMEGAYLAGRFLITDPPVTADEVRSPQPFRHLSKPDIPDYALPFWEAPPGDSSDAQPATWLAVIGSDGYWPLATLKDTLGNAPRFSSLAPVRRDQKPPPRRPLDRARPQRLSLSGSWRFFSILAVVLLAVHYFACRYGWDRQSLVMFVQFTPLTGRRGPALIASGWAAVCAILLVLFLSALRIISLLDFPDIVWVTLMGLATAAAFVAAMCELRWWSLPPAAAQQRKTHRKQLYDYRLVTAWTFLGLVLFCAGACLTFDFGHPGQDGVITAYRSVHLLSGISPVVPLLALLAGFYWWFWNSLSGLALLGAGRPILPRSDRERNRKTGNLLAEQIEQAALPFPQFGKSTLLLYSLPLLVVLLLAFVLQRAWMQAFDLILHSLENVAFNRTLHALIAIGLYLILLDCLQLYSTWLVLKRLLVELDRLPLKRTFAALQGLSMRSLWRLSGTGSRSRSKVFSRQMDSLLHLANALNEFASRHYGTPRLRSFILKTWHAGRRFTETREEGKDFAMLNNRPARWIRLRDRACAELILDDLLLPAWRRETGTVELQPASADGHESIKLSDSLPVRAGEEFVCLIYVGYLQNLLGRMRTMVLSMIGIFAAIALAVGLYPFTPRPTISLSLLFLLLFMGTVVGLVFAGLDRDSTLSHITNTEPGSLGAHFWLRMISFIGVPALGLIVAQFPEITDFVFSWIQPTMNAMK